MVNMLAFHKASNVIPRSLGRTNWLCGLQAAGLLPSDSFHDARSNNIPLLQRPKWVIIPPLAAFEGGQPALRAWMGKVSCVRWCEEPSLLPRISLTSLIGFAPAQCDGVVAENAWVFGAGVPSTADSIRSCPTLHHQTIRIDLPQPGPSPMAQPHRHTAHMRICLGWLGQGLVT
jgi:hypothetical protein